MGADRSPIAYANAREGFGASARAGTRVEVGVAAATGTRGWKSG